jgi:hypothetical protein
MAEHRFHRLFSVQQYLWLVAFLSLSAGVFLLSQRFTFVTRMARQYSLLFLLFGGGVGLFLVSNIVLAAYYRYQGYLGVKRSFGGPALILLYLGLAAAVLWHAEAWTLIDTLEAGQSGGFFGLLRVIAGLATGFVFLTGAITWWFLRERWGMLAAIPAVLFVLVFVFVFGLHYTHVGTAVNELDEFAVKDPFAGTGGFAPLLSEARTVPPPLDQYSVFVSGVMATGQATITLQHIQRETAAGRILTGPGERCEGLRRSSLGNLSTPDDFYVFWKDVVVRDLQLNRDRVQEYVDVVCSGERSPYDCASYTAVERQDAVDSFLTLQQEQVAVFQRLTGARDTVDDQLAVRGCDTDAPHYGVRLANISCHDGVTMTLEDKGTEPLPDRFDLYVEEGGRLNTSLTRLATPLEREDDYFIASSQQRSLREGKNYTVSLQSEELQLQAYCIGGNGFCEDCGPE